jgi:hypothetical protein
VQIITIQGRPYIRSRFSNDFLTEALRNPGLLANVDPDNFWGSFAPAEQALSIHLERHQTHGRTIELTAGIATIIGGVAVVTAALLLQ